MTLSIEYREVFGRVLVYPRCKKSEVLASLMGKKTFSKKEIETIKNELNIKFKVLPTNIT